MNSQTCFPKYRQCLTFQPGAACRQPYIWGNDQEAWTGHWVVAHSSPSKEQASFNFMAAVTIYSDFGAPKIICHCFHCFLIYLPWSNGPRCHDLSFLNVEFYSNFFTLLFRFIKRLFSSSSLSAIRVVSSAYLRLLIYHSLIIHPLNWSIFGCFQVWQLWMYKHLCAGFCVAMFSVPLGKYQGIWLLDHVVRICLVLQKNCWKSSKVAVPFCIPTSNAWEFLLSPILVSIYCCSSAFWSFY